MLEPILCMFSLTKMKLIYIIVNVIKEGLCIYLCLYSEICGMSGLKKYTVDPVVPRTGFPIDKRK